MQKIIPLLFVKIDLDSIAFLQLYSQYLAGEGVFHAFSFPFTKKEVYRRIDTVFLNRPYGNLHDHMYRSSS